MIAWYLKDAQKVGEGKEENRKKKQEHDGWKGEAGIKAWRQRDNIPFWFYHLLVI